MDGGRPVAAQNRSALLAAVFDLAKQEDEENKKLATKRNSEANPKSPHCPEEFDDQLSQIYNLNWNMGGLEEIW